MNDKAASIIQKAQQERKRAQFAHHDPRPCLMPPDWSKGYTSIFALQQEEEVEIAR